MKVIIFDKNAKKIFEGDYLYLEGGFEKNAKPSFHITANNPSIGDYEVYFYCKNKEEVEGLIWSLKKEILDKNPEETNED